MSTSLNWPSIANPIWPLDEVREDNVLRSKMEDGTEITRLRRSRSRLGYVLRWTRMKTADKDSLVTFYDTTTAFGSLSFNWTNPLTSVSKEYRFIGPPKISGVDPGYWAVECQISEV